MFLNSSWLELLREIKGPEYGYQQECSTDSLHFDRYFLHLLYIVHRYNAVSQPNQEGESRYFLAHHHLFEKAWERVAKTVNADPMMCREEVVCAGTEMCLPTKERNAKKYISPFGWLTFKWMWSSWRITAARALVLRWAGWQVPFYPTSPLVSPLVNWQIRTSSHFLSPLMGMPGKLQCKVKSLTDWKEVGRKSVLDSESLGSNSSRSPAKVLVPFSWFVAIASSLLCYPCKELSFQLCKLSRSPGKCY